MFISNIPKTNKLPSKNFVSLPSHNFVSPKGYGKRYSNGTLIKTSTSHLYFTTWVLRNHYGMYSNFCNTSLRIQKAHELFNDATSLMNSKQFANAELSNLSALDLFQSFAPDSPMIGKILFNMGYCYQHETRLKEAEQYYKEAISFISKDTLESGSASHLMIGVATSHLSEVYYLKKEFSLAEQCLRSFIQKNEKEYSKYPQFDMWISNVCGYLIAQKKYEEAKIWGKRALNRLISRFGIYNEFTKICQTNLVFVLNKLNAKEELLELKNAWKRCSEEESKIFSTLATNQLKDIRKEIELLEKEWIITKPGASTPSGFFLPKNFIPNLWTKAKEDWVKKRVVNEDTKEKKVE